MNRNNSFELSRYDRIIFGICGALGQRLGIDSNIVRIFAFICAITVYPPIIPAVYLFVAALCPTEPENNWKDTQYKDQ